MDLHTINFLSNVGDDNYDNSTWIKNLLQVGINNLLTKYNQAFPFRMVMLRNRFCHICQRSDVDIFSERCDDFSGLYGQVGWIYCKKCVSIMHLYKKNYEKKQSYLTYTRTKFLRDKSYNFWRVSSNSSIVPYIQEKAKCLKCNGNTITMFEKRGDSRLYIPVFWKYMNEEYNKSLPLANLLQFNRDTLGYNKESFGITDLNKKWEGLIQKEYDIANIWSNILVVFHKKNIPNGIIRKICLLWGNLA